MATILDSSGLNRGIYIYIYTIFFPLFGEGNGNPLQYSYLENLMDRGAWWTTVHEITESDTTELLTLI